jgi:hypothetical protein
MHLSRSQEMQKHVEHLYQLALSLGVDVISSVQQPVSILEHHHFYFFCWGLGCDMKETRQIT